MNDLSLISIKTFWINTIDSWVFVVANIISFVIILSLGIILLDFAVKTIFLGRSSFLTSHVKFKGNYFLDHAPFIKPYKGYNRLRSREWNLKNTM